MILDSITLSTVCIQEGAYVFANTDPTAPVIKIVDRIVPKTIVKDEDEKHKYNSALAAWVIVFIIIFIASIFMAYIVSKGRKILTQESKDMSKMEAVYNAKKAEAEE